MSDLLIELVRRYSPSTHESPAIEYLIGWMAAHGFDSFIDKAGNACGIRGDQDAARTLMLLGHIDTVPGEIPVRIEDGCLYGRGSVDAKGSLAAMVEATARAVIPVGWRVVVIGAVEEEVATSKGAHYVREHFRPDFCIIGEPSGAGRITLGYKGRLLVDYALRRALAHTARPEPTVGALGADFWQQILSWAEQQNAGIERYFDQVMPSLRAINTRSDSFHDELMMTVGFRLPPRLSPEATLNAISAFALPDGQLQPYGMELAYVGERNNALVRGMLAAIRQQSGQPGFVLKTGTSDMNVVGAVWDCPIIAYGPGDSDLDHTPHEHLPLEEYQRAVATLRAFIEGLA